MPSPFPGMNPYLEQDDVWQDFHDRLIPVIGDAISPQVSPDFIVKIEEHLYIRELPAEQRIRVGSGDVTVSRRPTSTSSDVDTSIAVAPARIVIPALEEKQTYLKILDRKSRDVVTVIELLSPTNKRSGPDREQYLGKRGNLLRSKANLVEIDLLRGGPRLPLCDPPECDYYVLVSRVEGRPEADFWPIQLRDRLPVIPIPLRGRADANLDLQAVLNTVYDRAYYKDHIYDGEPAPHLKKEDVEWARAIIKDLDPERPKR